MCSLFLSNVSFGQKSTVVTNAGDVGLTMSNVGFLGNSFRGNFQLENEPSCEFPINSGVEHLFEGGLWIGATLRGSQAVSTASYDNASGYSTGGGGYEMTAEVGTGFKERSSLFNSKVFDPLSDVYIGMFANAVIRNVNITPAGAGGTAFYDKGANGYNDSLYMG